MTTHYLSLINWNPFHKKEDPITQALLRTPGTGEGGVFVKQKALHWGVIITNDRRLIQLETDLPNDLEINKQYTEALYQIKKTTNLSWDAIADLLNVTRQSVNLWREQQPIAVDNRRQILEVRDVLDAATRRGKDVAVWLDIPQGRQNVTPRQLIKEGEFDRARYLAVTTPSAKKVITTNRIRRPVAERFKVEYDPFPQAEPPESE